MTGGSGGTWPAFARYSGRDMCWLKTSRHCSQRLIQWDDADPSWELFSETWPRSGIAWSGTAYRLPVLARPTDVIGASSSALWPTPTTRDWKDTPGMARESVNEDGTTRDRTDLLPRRIYASTEEAGEPLIGHQSVEWTEVLMGFPAGWTSVADGSADFQE